MNIKIIAPLVILIAASISSTLWSAGIPDKLPKVDQKQLDKMKEAMPEKPTVEPKKPRKILVFWLCEGYFHTAIPTANKCFEIMGEKTGVFETVFSKDMSVFNPDYLDQFDAIMFNNTSDLKFADPNHRQALMDFVKGGKGVIGIHAATDCFKNWPEAAKMMGGIFDGHPWHARGTWAVKVDDPGHPINKAFSDGKTFFVRDEIYQLKGPYTRDRLRVLLSLDMSDKRNMMVKKEQIHRKDNDFAISYIQTWGKGRVFYCSFGHNKFIFWHPQILQHYLDGIQYALGDLPADATPSAELSASK